MKALPILNAVGCLGLIVIIVVQWNKGEEIVKERNAALVRQRNTENEKIEVEKRVYQLQSDVNGLKASIDAMRAEAEALEKKVADGEELVNHLNIGLHFSHANFQGMEQAIAERDARIVQLNSSLVATRNRLDEAIERLKQAGAR